MTYIIVEPQGTLTSFARAHAISREIYCISAPRLVQEEYQRDRLSFDMVNHPNQDLTALIIDASYKIVVHPLASLERLVALFPELTETERLNLSAFIYNRPFFNFGQIIPSSVIVRTREEMETLGWFASNEI